MKGTEKTYLDYILVVFQLILFLIFFIPGDWSKLPSFLQLPGWVFFVGGSLITIVSIFKLDKNLTIFPTPKQDGLLLTNGLYKYIRHPIYSGVILVFLGAALIYLSVFKLVITSFLIILFMVKTTYEEKQLEKKFPEYREYKNHTGRFFPFF